MNENATRLLMFEDNPDDVTLIREQLSESGDFFEIISFDQLSNGLEYLDTNNVDVVLLDLGLPDSQGLNTVEMVMARNSSVPIIILTGPDEEIIAMEAVRHGAQDYFIKGSASIEILPRIIRYSIERKNAEKELKLSIERFNRALSDTVKAMAMAVETRDPYTAGHQRRGAGLARAIALEMRLDQKEIEGVQLAFMIHDIGKISIPSEILSKPCLLSPLEISLIRAHPQVGYDILKEIDFPWPIAQTVLQHHERIDGSGYPEGLKNNDIILEARILAVADVLEAMSSHRPYRPALGIREALSEIDRKQGILYDPTVVKGCLNLFQNENYTF